MRVWVMMLFLLVSSGCTMDSSYIVDTSYKALKTGAVLYDTTMNTAASMHSQGLLSDDKYEQVKDAALIYYRTYHVVVDLLMVYIQTGDQSMVQQLEETLSVLQGDINTLLILAAKLGIPVEEVDDANNVVTGNS